MTNFLWKNCAICFLLFKAFHRAMKSQNPMTGSRSKYSSQVTKFLQKYSLKIPEKFLGLCHHVYGFLREFIKRISFKKFLGISPEFHPKKFLKNSPECFSGNSFEILKTWSPSLRIFRGISFEKFLRISLEFFSRNS